jgi:hypothetical protein
MRQGRSSQAALGLCYVGGPTSTAFALARGKGVGVLRPDLSPVDHLEKIVLHGCHFFHGSTDQPAAARS